MFLLFVDWLQKHHSHMVEEFLWWEESECDHHSQRVSKSRCAMFCREMSGVDYLMRLMGGV